MIVKAQKFEVGDRQHWRKQWKWGEIISLSAKLNKPGENIYTLAKQKLEGVDPWSEEVIYEHRG